VSGASKGYRYITGMSGVITSRHHSMSGAEGFRKRNAHQPIVIYTLPRSMPLAEGEEVPECAVDVPMTKAKPKPSTYRR
jgi:hypothetical protein